VQDAAVALPRAEPKPVEKKEEVQPPAPETRAPPKNDHVGQFTQAASNAYNALVVGHLARFKRYPAAAHGAAGKVTVRFVLSRSGEVLDCAVVASSGNAAIDREVVDILRRASPFPAFPAAKPGDRDSYTIPIAFAPH
jgi:periplasmic protein TonB